MRLSGQDLLPPGHDADPDKALSLKQKLLRITLFLLAFMAGVPILSAAAILIALWFGPINLTPFLRPFFPLVIAGDEQIDIKSAQLAWLKADLHRKAAIHLTVQDLQVRRANGQLADTLKSGRLSMTAGPLLHGKLNLLNLSLDGAHITLLRHENGEITPDLDQRNLKHSDGDPAISLAILRHLSIHQTDIVLRDPGLHATFRLPIEADISTASSKHHYGLTGYFKAESYISTGVTTKTPYHLITSISGRGLQQEDGSVVWKIGTGETNPSHLQELFPELHDYDFPLSLETTLHLLPGKTPWLMLPTTANVQVSLGAGSLKAAGTTYFIDNGAGSFQLLAQDHGHAPYPVTLAMDSFKIQLASPPVTEQDNLQDTTLDTEKHELTKINLNTQAHLLIKDIRNPSAIEGLFSASIPEFEFSDLPSWWPATAGKGARKWVVKNIQSGHGKNLHIALYIAPRPDGRNSKVTAITGGLDANDLEIWWLRPISPLHGVDAHLEISDMKQMKITFDHGYQDAYIGKKIVGRVQNGPGSMVITDLDKKDQTGKISVTLDGKLANHIAILSEPRLHILSKNPFPFSNPSGTGLVSFTLTLPLDAHITNDQVTLQGKAHFTQVHLGKVVMDRDIDNGTIDLNVTMNGMNFSGDGTLGTWPFNATGQINFMNAGPLHEIENVEATAHITPEQAGPPASSHFTGVATLEASYHGMSDGTATSSLLLKLQETDIHIPLWHKPMGQPAEAGAELALRKGQLAAVTNLHATGPQLDLMGSAKLSRGANGLTIPYFRIGQSFGSARFRIPENKNSPIGVTVRARLLDLSPLLDEEPTQKDSSSLHIPEAASGRLHGQPTRPWLISAHADTVLINKTGRLNDVQADLSHNGSRIEKMHISTAFPVAARADLIPTGKQRDLNIDVADLGRLAAETGLSENILGGHAILKGSFNDTRASAPFRGLLTISPFVLKNVPSALITARNLSIYGWLNAVGKDSFKVSHFNLPLTYSNGILTVQEGRAGNSALGATFNGPLNLDQSTISVDGTIVPAFVLNTFPGHLPGIGGLLSPEKDGGLLAIKFKIRGKFDDPDFSISPMSIFLPGVLRNIL